VHRARAHQFHHARRDSRADFAPAGHASSSVIIYIALSLILVSNTGAFSVVPSLPSAANSLVTDDRIACLSFTGSPKIGWALKSQAGKKRVLLELGSFLTDKETERETERTLNRFPLLLMPRLGGMAPVIVDKDAAADLDYVVSRLVFGAFYYQGQSCISVQNVYVHEVRLLSFFCPSPLFCCCCPCKRRAAYRLETESVRKAQGETRCCGRRAQDGRPHKRGHVPGSHDRPRTSYPPPKPWSLPSHLVYDSCSRRRLESSRGWMRRETRVPLC
jgi:hypothetical protein